MTKLISCVSTSLDARRRSQLRPRASRGETQKKALLCRSRLARSVTRRSLGKFARQTREHPSETCHHPGDDERRFVGCRRSCGMAAAGLLTQNASLQIRAKLG